MKSFTKIQNEKDITVKQYVDEQNALNKIYTTFTPEGGVEGKDYAVTVPGLKTLEIGTSLTIKPHVQNTQATLTLSVNDFGSAYLERVLSGSNTSIGFSKGAVRPGRPIEIIYIENDSWVDKQAKPDSNDLFGPLGISRGGTGAMQAAVARENLGAAATVHTHTTSDITDLSAILNNKVDTVYAEENYMAKDFSNASLSIGFNEVVLPTNSSCYSIAYGDEKFVAIIKDSNKVVYSADGISWTEATLPSSRTWLTIVYGGGKFIITSHYGPMFYSSDGITWEQGYTPSTSYYSVAYGNGKYVAVGNGSNCLYSEDGINWQTAALPFTDFWYSITYGDGKFIGVANSSKNKAIYSIDGITWTQADLPSVSWWRAITYGNGKFVAVSSATGKGAYSNDGISWTQINTSLNEALYCIAYGDNKFVATAHNSDKAIYSEDGISWTQTNLPSSGYWDSIAYGGNKFVAINRDANKCAYSIPPSIINLLGEGGLDDRYLKSTGGTVSGDVTLSEDKKLIISSKTKGGQDVPVSLSSTNEIVLVSGSIPDDSEVVAMVTYFYYEEAPNPNGDTATAWLCHELDVEEGVVGDFLEGQTFTINGTVISAYDFITGAVEVIGPCTQCSYTPPSGVDISHFTDGRRLCNSNSLLDTNIPIFDVDANVNDGEIFINEEAGGGIEEGAPEEVVAQSAFIVESEEVQPDGDIVEEPGEIGGILEPIYDSITSTYQATTFLNIDQGISVNGEASFNNHAIHAVGWPTHPQDAARKDYVDASILEAMNSTPSMEAITVYKPCRIIVGSSAYGWDESKVDYLCDGIDDQVEINEAINFIVASSNGSITEKEIVLLDGVYNLTSGINIILDNVTIRGNGNSTIFKRMYSEDTTSRGILDISGSTGCKICDLCFDNNISEYNFFYNKTLSLNSCNYITVQNCTFTNSRTAVSLIGSTRCNIINNSFSNNNTAIDVQNNGNNIISNNYIYGNNNNGIFIVSCNNNNINGNIVENCNYGITINSTSSSVATGNSISDNTCSNNKTGISVSSNNSSYSFSMISGNVCNDCSYYGISISSHGNTVTGNTCCNYGERGININNGNANTITGNTCIRGSGTASDYSSTQYTIYNYGENNLICANNIMGKDCYNQGTNATIVNNKYQ